MNSFFLTDFYCFKNLFSPLEIFQVCIGLDTGITLTEIATFSTEEKTNQAKAVEF